MNVGVDIAQTAALVGDPGRANMLALLLDGRAHTASELAWAAGVTRPTASGHLSRLEAGRLIAAARQGRHRYFRLASPAVASMLESLMAVANAAPPRPRATPRVPAALRDARTCYDHIAGRLGVAIADALVRRGAVTVSGDEASITPAGVAFFADLGLRSIDGGRGARASCRACLDWSERRPHLAGALGAALLDHALENRWLKRAPSGRQLRVTVEGAAAFTTSLGVDRDAL